MIGVTWPGSCDRIVGYGRDMSMEVPIDSLAAVAAAYGPTAYAVVSTPDAAPRITHVRPRFDEGPRVRIGVGRRSVDRLRECGAIGLLWPAGADQSMSLIVDGELEWADDDGEILVRLISAVRHRPAP